MDNTDVAPLPRTIFALGHYNAPPKLYSIDIKVLNIPEMVKIVLFFLKNGQIGGKLP